MLLIFKKVFTTIIEKYIIFSIMKGEEYKDCIKQEIDN